MAKSKIEIIFNGVPDIGANITIGDNLNPQSLEEVAVEVRSNPYKFSTPWYDQFNSNGEPDPRDRWFGNSALYYGRAFRLDYNGSDRYRVVDYPNDAGTGRVVITALQSNVVFTHIASPDTVTINITNESETAPIEIEKVELVGAASDFCAEVIARITTNVVVASVNGVDNTDGDNPVDVLVSRGVNYNIVLTAVDGSQTSYTPFVPKLLVENVSVIVSSFPSGSTANISVHGLGLGSFDTILEFSLDNQGWKSSNAFGSLAEGDYTAYVRDKYGCKVQKGFTVNAYEDVSSSSAYAPLPSKANSIRFKKDVDWENCSLYKTDENTLSCEVDVDLPYREVQRFQTCDSETTQIRSSFKTIEATVTDSNSLVTSLSVTKQTDFMNRKDKRDAIAYSIGNGETAIRFGSGSTYDYYNGSANGTYILNGYLPTWAVIGNYVVYGGTWFMIQNILFDESKSSEIVVIYETSQDQEEIVVVSSLYNIFNYEVYEFTIDFANFNGKQITAKIKETDNKYADVSFTSELMDIKERHTGTLELLYFSEDNTDIFFGTGIKFKIRIPYISMRGLSEGETTVHKTDSNVVMLSTINYEGDEIVFEPMSKEMWRKVMVALSHPSLTINGQGYLKMPGSFSSDGPLDDTNLYALIAKMLKTTNVSGNSGEGRNYVDGTEKEIPGAISPDGSGGYVQY